jgi:hypothetical protein
LSATAGTWSLSAPAMSAGDSPALPRRPRRAAAWLAGVAADNAPGAAWRARLRRQDVWIQAGAGAVMGLAIIALKLVLH